MRSRAWAPSHTEEASRGRFWFRLRTNAKSCTPKYGAAERILMKADITTRATPHEIVRKMLEHYARRGVFRGFSPGPVRAGKARFKLVWHRDRVFELVLDTKKSTIRFPLLLPNVARHSLLDKELRKFVKSRQVDDLPDHRRIDRKKAEARLHNRAGDVSLSLKLIGDDYEYGTRKLVHLVHEIFLDFLHDGRYFEYMIENFDFDPDRL